MWRCLKSQAVKPGKGGAFNQVELKSITKGTKLNERFRSSETIEKASLDERDFQYLCVCVCVYSDNDNLVFMDNLKSFEQINVSKDTIGDENILKENMEVKIEFHEENPLIVTLPKSADYEILETEAVVKGQTVSSSYKPAIIQNNVKIMVPPFINQRVILFL